jgi:hypothetical protein
VLSALVLSAGAKQDSGDRVEPAAT